MPLASKLSKKSKEVTLSKSPVWLGPESDDDQGGVTFSLLSRFLVCKERFRIHVMEGLRPRQQFSHRMSYGNMWHICEENFALLPKTHAVFLDGFFLPLEEYCDKLRYTFRNDKEEITKWERVCKLQFPIYVKYWKKHPDMQARTPLLSEQVFKIPYKLPSGRVVYLRGKWDSVDLVGKGKAAKIFLQENKCKGDIDFAQIQRQLKFDLQVLMYLTSLQEKHGGETNGLGSSGVVKFASDFRATPIAGVRYNIVRRPLSGGKGTIVRHKATKNKSEETWDCYFDRLAVIITEDPENYFQRWNVEISSHEIERFRQTCLDPILENLCYWYDCETGKDILTKTDDYGLPPHSWITPFGCYNSLMEGGSTELDYHLETGSLVGLERVTELFPELKE